MITLDVKNTRAGARVLDRIERNPTARAGYSVVTYKGCLYRVRRNGVPYIDLDEPLRCRGEVWARPTGAEARRLCADFKRQYKLTRRNRRRDAAWWLSRARWLRCAWLKEARR